MSTNIARYYVRINGDFKAIIDLNKEDLSFLENKIKEMDKHKMPVYELEADLKKIFPNMSTSNTPNSTYFVCLKYITKDMVNKALSKGEKNNNFGENLFNAYIAESEIEKN